MMPIADASATGAALLGLRALGSVPPGTLPAVPAGPVYSPGPDRPFYARHHRAFDALRAQMREQEAALGRGTAAGADAIATGGPATSPIA